MAAPPVLVRVMHGLRHGNQSTPIQSRTAARSTSRKGPSPSATRRSGDTAQPGVSATDRKVGAGRSWGAQRIRPGTAQRGRAPGRLGYGKAVTEGDAQEHGQREAHIEPAPARDATRVLAQSAGYAQPSRGEE